MHACRRSHRKRADKSNISQISVLMKNKEMDIDKDLNEQNKYQHEQFTFNTVKNKISTLKLPNSNWHTITPTGVKLISFYTVLDDGIIRRVDLFPDLSVQVVIDLILVSENSMPRLSCFNDIVEFLETVNRWNLCDTLKNTKGCIPLKSCEGVLPWTSRLQNICPSCASGIKLSDDENDSDQIEEERKRDLKIRRRTNQRLRRRRMRIHYLESQVSALRKQCADVDEEILEHVIKLFDDTRKAEFRTCFDAARKVGEVENEMQYDIEWINQCLLIRTNYEETYDKLRERDSLPLPPKQMLTRFINLLL